MIARRVMQFILLMQAVALAACGSSSNIDGPEESPPLYRYTITLVSPRSLRAADAFGIVPDTIVVEMRDSVTRKLSARNVIGVSSNGWFRLVGASKWARSAAYNTDSVGRLRLEWQFTGSAEQRLSVSASGVSTPVRLTATPLRAGVTMVADTVVTSGPAALCIQEQGRVGCIGEGRCATCVDSATISRDPGRIHWFRFQSPIVYLSSNSVGACVLLADGNTSCWDGLGPDSVSRNDVGHPPFVELRGIVGRTASGALWIKPRGLARQMNWLLVSSDSTFSALLDQNSEGIFCARTASFAVMCAAVRDMSFNGPDFRIARMMIVRNSRDSSIVRAIDGFAAQDASPDFRYERVVVRRIDGSSVAFRRDASDTTVWNAREIPDSSLAGSDPRVRACAVMLRSICDAAHPWRSFSQVSTLTTEHLNYEAGYQRSCAVRDVIVCHTRDATGRLHDGWSFRTLPMVSVDTIRLAP
jgi:hypothetical protein